MTLDELQAQARDHVLVTSVVVERLQSELTAERAKVAAAATQTKTAAEADAADARRALDQLLAAGAVEGHQEALAAQKLASAAGARELCVLLAQKNRELAAAQAKTAASLGRPTARPEAPRLDPRGPYKASDLALLDAFHATHGGR